MQRSDLTMPTLKAHGFYCKRTESTFGEHYAIFHAGFRVMSRGLTPTTARAAWDDLRRDIEAGRIGPP